MFSRFLRASDQFQGPEAHEQFLALLANMSGRKIEVTLPQGTDKSAFSYRMDPIGSPDRVMSLTTVSPVRLSTAPARIEQEQVVFQLSLDDTRPFLETRREILYTPGMGLASLDTRDRIAWLHDGGCNLTLSIPLEWVANYLTRDVLACDRTIAGDNPHAALLRGYCLSVHRQADRLKGEPLADVMRYIAELSALALGARSEGACQARRGALPGARLEMAKQFVRRSLADTGLNDEAIGRYLGVSAPAVRRIFHVAGLSVSGFIRDCRLEQARAMLRQPLYDGMRIIEISHLCGFSDISTFNRSYVRKFGQSPGKTRSDRPV